MDKLSISKALDARNTQPLHQIVIILQTATVAHATVVDAPTAATGSGVAPGATTTTTAATCRASSPT